jgi:hypothetical protein
MHQRKNSCPILNRIPCILIAGLLAHPAGADVVEFDVGLGYRQDALDWNIASDLSGSSTPNILSELTWSNVQLLTLDTQVELIRTHTSRLHVTGHFSIGKVFAGDNQDSDYLGDNRTLEFSRSNNQTDDGDSLEAQVTFGYRFGRFPALGRRGQMLVPYIGYGYRHTELTISEGNQTVSDYGNITPLGPFSGLDSTYSHEWTGPLAGVKWQYDNGRRFRLMADVQWHAVNYEGEGIWNLRSDFRQDPSFRHTADGYGAVIRVGTIFQPSKQTQLTLRYVYERWRTDPGLDMTFFSNDTIAVLRLNEVNWSSNRFIFSMSYLY